MTDQRGDKEQRTNCSDRCEAVPADMRCSFCPLRSAPSAKPATDQEIRKLAYDAAKQYFHPLSKWDGAGAQEQCRMAILHALSLVVSAPSSTASSDPDAAAKALFENNSAGYRNKTPWDELHDDTRQLWRDEAAKRSAPASGAAISPWDALRAGGSSLRPFNEHEQDVLDAFRRSLDDPIQPIGYISAADREWLKSATALGSKGGVTIKPERSPEFNWPVYAQPSLEQTALSATAGKANPPCYEIDGNCPDYQKCIDAGRCQWNRSVDRKGAA